MSGRGVRTIPCARTETGEGTLPLDASQTTVTFIADLDARKGTFTMHFDDSYQLHDSEGKRLLPSKIFAEFLYGQILATSGSESSGDVNCPRPITAISRPASLTRAIRS